MLIVLKSKKGMSLIEVMLAVLIIIIIILGSSFLYVFGIGYVGLSKNYQVAAQLAAQKLEQFRADNHFHIDIPVGTTSEDISLGDVSYTRSTETTETEETVDSGLCKKVKVNVYWTQMGKQHKVSLVSLYVNR